MRKEENKTRKNPGWKCADRRNKIQKNPKKIETEKNHRHRACVCVCSTICHSQARTSTLACFVRLRWWCEALRCTEMEAPRSDRAVNVSDPPSIRSTNSNITAAAL